MPARIPPTAVRSGLAHVFDDAFVSRLEAARAITTAALLRERDPRSGWTGELSSSALSTATAVTALTLHASGLPAAGGNDGVRESIRQGCKWLVAHQNADGGWGDTPESSSNISTTTLVWATLGLDTDSRAEAAVAVAAGERWLGEAAGSLEPAHLVRAIEACYGADRTFSIPILTMCALCGRLGASSAAWRHVRQLPFEVAALPQRWFAALRLPVVSYALPALIAIGQVRHGLRPTSNLPLRWLRDRCRARTLEKLGRLQPENGGFLEATPLTSFVVMSLAALGLHDHPVVRRGVAFLRKAVRSDGSWPIDTNLATWVTTLAVNALMPASSRRADGSIGSAGGVPAVAVGEGSVSPANACGPEARAPRQDDAVLSDADRSAIRGWLLGQQFRERHPYTLATPGGWAWTDLPGGVPDADDTAGALLALHRLGPTEPGAIAAAAAGITWLLELQNRDGGMPTFCRGWGKLPFDRSSPDLTAHAIRAWLAWRMKLSAPLRRRVDAAMAKAAAFLRENQRADGGWIPLWFGHQQHPAGENPLYGTARVVPAFCELEVAGAGANDGALDRALHWLVSRQNDDGGWSGAAGAASSIEETAVALDAIATAWERERASPDVGQSLLPALRRGAEWLVAAVEGDRWRRSAPIGLYFAKLWYHERLYPMVFATGALRQLTRLR